MERVLGGIVNMSEVVEGQLNISALGTPKHTTTDDGATTTQRSSNIRDYGTGHAMIIKKLSELNKKVDGNHSVMVDVKNMIIDLAHTVSKLNDTVATLQGENAHLKFKIQEI